MAQAKVHKSLIRRIKKMDSNRRFFSGKRNLVHGYRECHDAKKLVSDLPEWFLHSKSGDIPLYVILAEQGDIAYLDQNMSVYRKNEGGLSYTDSTSSEDFLNNRIFMYSKINEYTQFKYDSHIRQIVFEYKLLLIHSSRNQKMHGARPTFFLRPWGTKLLPIDPSGNIT